MSSVLIVGNRIWKIHEEQEANLITWGESKSNCMGLEPAIYEQVKPLIDKITLIVFGSVKIDASVPDTVPEEEDPQVKGEPSSELPVFETEEPKTNGGAMFDIEEDTVSSSPTGKNKKSK